MRESIFNIYHNAIFNIRIYGTMLFDSAIYKDKVPGMLERVINSIDEKFEVQLQIFEDINSKIMGKEYINVLKYKKWCFNEVKKN